MSLEWESCKIGELGKIFSGGTPSTKIKEYWDGDLNWLSSGETRNTYIYTTDKFITEKGANNSSTKLANKGDIVIASAGQGFTRGQSSMVMIDTYVNQSVIVISPNDKVNNYYLLYNLKFRYPELRQLSDHASTRGSLTTKIIKDLDIILPDLNTQNKIATIIQYFDKKIETNKKINRNLDYILDLLFKENFIDKFNNDDTDWKIKKVGELPLIITDYVANGSFASLKENVSILDYEDYAYFIRNTDLKSKCFGKFVNKHSYDFLKKSSLFCNEIIISNVGDVGSVFLCPFLDKPMTLGNNMILVKSNNDAIYLNFYLFLLFRSNYGQYLISTITAGSVQSKFNKTEFKSLELTMPDDELIIRFNEIVSPRFEYKNKISDEITNLTKLRDTLLPKLMSGEIDVSKINYDLSFQKIRVISNLVMLFSKLLINVYKYI